MSLEEFAGKVNAWGSMRVPFLFLMDFEKKKPLLFSLENINPSEILFDINGISNYQGTTRENKSVELIKYPVPFEEYQRKYDLVRSHLAYGDTYLTNLTVRTKIKITLPLREIFFLSKAKYKMWFKDAFLFFSPETFVRIRDGKISAYPMKGTIDAALPDAREKILGDRKEMAEHVTIVDLIRNDLSAVAENVSVTRFRYVDEIRTNQKNLLQISSEIQGDLPFAYRDQLGDILMKLLPAGSVSGAPKCKTVEIIQQAENEPRGYYTGVVGLFDGNVFDSGVMIRFIEQDQDTMFYRSGGGITMQSSAETEYQEIIDKVYVPLD